MSEDPSNKRLFLFRTNSRIWTIEASTWKEAMTEFQEKFGYWPTDDVVDMTVVKEDVNS